MKCRECGVEGVERGVESGECGVESVECGVWSVDCGVGEWESVERGVRSGEWKAWSVERRVWSARCGVWSGTWCKLCRTKQYLEVMCVHFVVQSSTERYFVQALQYKAVLRGRLCKLCSAKS